VLDWSCLSVVEMRLRAVVEGGVLRFVRDSGGRMTRVLVGVDGPTFTDRWLEAVSRAHAV